MGWYYDYFPHRHRKSGGLKESKSGDACVSAWMLDVLVPADIIRVEDVRYR
jgi:hypothetical protein